MFGGFGLKSSEDIISNKAVVETELIGPGTQIGDFAVVRADVRLGKNVIVHPHVVIEPGIVISDEVEIFPGAYIGKKPKGAGATAHVPEFQKKINIGAHCSIGANAVIYYDLHIGQNTLVGDGASIREQSVIGDQCVIGMNVTVGYSVTIHNKVRIMDHTHVVGKSLIEDNAFIAMNVSMANDPYIGMLGYKEELIQAITIRTGAMVGIGANLLPGVEIGEKAIVAAGALVREDVPARKMVAGIPAKEVKDA